MPHSPEIKFCARCKVESEAMLIARCYSTVCQVVSPTPTRWRSARVSKSLSALVQGSVCVRERVLHVVLKSR